jgi:hypothetical protein
VSTTQTAARPATESFTTAPGEAVYISKSGERSRGNVSIAVSTTSISAHFEDISTFAIPEERYGEPGGRLEAADGSWSCGTVTFTGTSSDGKRLFNCAELRLGAADTAVPVASTRLMLAGANWSGVSRFSGRAAVFHGHARDATSHHDARLSVAIEGELTPQERDTLESVASLCAGISTPILSVERYDANDGLLSTVHYRGYRRVGRFPHSPFPKDDAVLLRAFAAISEGVGPLRASGFPVDIVFDQITGSNVVAQIHLSAQLLMLAVQTTAFYLAQQSAAGAGMSDHRAIFAELVAELKLSVDDPGLDRLTAVRAELLDQGYFGAPGYETGRPQVDIKFVRDIAHTSMFRLCGYAGPFWSSERFRVESFV